MNYNGANANIIHIAMAPKDIVTNVRRTFPANDRDSDGVSAKNGYVRTRGNQ